MSQEQIQKDIAVYFELIPYIKEVSPEEAEQLVQADNGNTIFISKATCPYCRRFLPKLLLASENNRERLFYLQSDKDETQDAVIDFRNKYNAKTVPTLIYKKEGHLKVKSDSTMTIDEIKTYLNH